MDKPFTENEVQNTISSLIRNKEILYHTQIGYDKVVTDIFLDAKVFISPFLMKIFNKLYTDGTYPNIWIRGVIVAIYKKGENYNPSNRRGITLISTMAQIFSLT